EQTVLKINLEAVNEVVRQIRLRDQGGIIIIDFIDMEVLEHREQVEKALKRALAVDKARNNVMPISELGVVEMTRKRVRQDLRARGVRDPRALRRRASIPPPWLVHRPRASAPARSCSTCGWPRAGVTAARSRWPSTRCGRWPTRRSTGSAISASCATRWRAWS